MRSADTTFVSRLQTVRAEPDFNVARSSEVDSGRRPQTSENVTRGGRDLRSSTYDKAFGQPGSNPNHDPSDLVCDALRGADPAPLERRSCTFSGRYRTRSVFEFTAVKGRGVFVRYVLLVSI